MEQKKVEIVNTDLVNFLLEQETVNDEAKKILRGIVRNCQQKPGSLGTLTSTRKLSDDTANLGIGRRWIVKNLSLGSLPRNLRNFLTEPYYWDIDAKCCQPTLAYQYAKRLNLYMPSVEHYIGNTDTILQETMTVHKISRKEAKERFICMMYNSKSVTNLSTFEIQFKDEFQHLAAIAWLKNPEWHNVKFSSDKTVIKNTKNHAHKLLCHFLQTEERKMLDCLDSFLISKGRSLDIPMHDGGNVRKQEGEKEFSQDLLRQAEVYIEENTGYKIQLVQKPIEHTLGPLFTEYLRNPNPKNENRKLMHHFELNHFLMNGVLYKELPNHSLKMITNTHVYTAHIADRFWKYYITYAKRRYDDFGFYVYGMETPENIYNTFYGFEFEKLFPDIKNQGDYKEYLQMIHQSMDRQDCLDTFNESKTRVQLQEWLCNDNGVAYEYLIQWLARIINEPCRRSKKAIVLKNKCGGTGKTGFFSEMLLGKLLGNAMGSCDSAFEDVFGEKNGGAMASKMFFMCNEAEAATTKKYMNKIKEEITDTMHRVRFMYKDSYMENNLVNFVFNTNKDTGALQYERDNMRRFVYIDCAEKRLTHKEQLELADETNDPDFQRVFLWVLIDKYNPDFDFEIIPDSQTIEYLKEITTPPTELFINWLFVDWSDYVMNLFKETPEGRLIPCNWHHPKPEVKKGRLTTFDNQPEGPAKFHLNRDQVFALYRYFLKENLPEYKRCTKYSFGRDPYWKAFVNEHMYKNTHGVYSCDWHETHKRLTNKSTDIGFQIQNQNK